MSRAPSVVIVDYGMGNMLSVAHACAHVGLRARLVKDQESLLAADAAILPGVGAFGDAMAHLKQLDLVSPLRDFAASGRPFMGICLGLQLLLSESEEFGSHRGLDLVPGRVLRFPGRDRGGARVKVPQLGWNAVRRRGADWAETPLRDLPDGEPMYFVHSFYAQPADPAMALARSAYADTDYCSVLLKGNVFACQFHPEKSAWSGLSILRNWAAAVAVRRPA
jgi:glutamine amidotransferase